jgi:hypothetical protein
MKSMRSLLMVPSLIIAFYSCGNAQNWRKVEPLKSTRAEVEALLGAAQGAYSAIYQLKEGSLFIEYSSGPCTPDRHGGWNVAENVVVSLSFSPRHKKRFDDLKIDREKFRKEVDQHVIGITYYVNDEDGITYEIQDGRVASIEYGPPKKYRPEKR